MNIDDDMNVEQKPWDETTSQSVHFDCNYTQVVDYGNTVIITASDFIFLVLLLTFLSFQFFTQYRDLGIASFICLNFSEFNIGKEVRPE